MEQNNNIKHEIIYTNKGEEIKVDAEDYEYLLAQCPWYISNRGLVVRARRRRDKQRYEKFTLCQCTREIFGFPPQEYRVYHRNGDKLDCRKSNLILVTASKSQSLERSRNAQPVPEFTAHDWEPYIVKEEELYPSRYQSKIVSRDSTKQY